MKPEYRFMTDTELINCVVSDNCMDMTQLNMSTILNQLTPAKRKFAETMIELYKRSLQQTANRAAIRCSADIFRLMQPVLCDLEVEEFWFVGLNNSGKVIDKVRLSIGGMAGTSVDVRVMAKKLLEINATQCAILHNHPSGAVKPSNEDKNLTAEIKKGLSFLNIRLLDHIIIGHDAYYSFADEGMI